ncbi:MAG: CRISPR-associated endonuclease Cas2 [Bacteroidota bacterium]
MLYLIAYDISDDKLRTQLGKRLEDEEGRRINFSIFECYLSKARLRKLGEWILPKLDEKTDQLAIYPICKSCYEKTLYWPDIEEGEKGNSTVVIR